MTLTGISNLLTSRKEKERRRIAVLRGRDGDDCRRCRRPLRFDLPSGYDLAPRVEHVADDSEYLTHGRCNPSMVDHTGEVLDRVRRKAEAELLAKPKRRKKAAGAR
jgi:hypothetical protein